MAIRDITRPLSASMPIWEGDPPVVVQPQLRLESGDAVATCRISLGSHSGTHIDAPAHILKKGTTVNQLDLQLMVGPTEVIDCRGLLKVKAQHLDERVPNGAKRLLILEDEPLVRDGLFVSCVPLANDAVEWLLHKQVQLVGISGPSVDTFDSEYLPAHHTLLEAGVVIIENLELSAVPAGSYYLVCLPLALTGVDGAPARVILLDI